MTENGSRPASSSGGEGSDEAGRTAVRVPVERVRLAAATTWIPATSSPGPALAFPGGPPAPRASSAARRVRMPSYVKELSHWLSQ